MVLLLAFDIRDYRIHMTVANAKCTITLLPEKLMERVIVLLVDPSCGARFYGSYDFGQIRLFTQQE